MFNVLIACLENWDSLQEIPFVIKKGGCTTDVFCSKDSWLISNSFFDNWIESSNDPADYAQQLIDLVKNKTPQYDWVILGDEKLLKLMNDRVDYEWLFKKILPLTKIENREVLASKAGFSVFCEKHAILTPRYRIYNENADPDAIIEGLAFPLLFKPDLSWGGSAILICDNKDSVKTNLAKISAKRDLVIQEFITGKDIGVEALFKDGDLITYNCSEVLEYFDSKFAYTTKRKYFNNTEIEPILQHLGNSMGIHGFASISFIYEPERRLYYLIEADLRPNFWLPYGRFTGNDFSEGIKKFINPGYLKADGAAKRKILKKEIEVALFYRDIRRCWKKKDFKGFFKWVFNYKNYWRYIPFYDRRLLKSILKAIVHDFLKKLKIRPA